MKHSYKIRLFISVAVFIFAILGALGLFYPVKLKNRFFCTNICAVGFNIKIVTK